MPGNYFRSWLNALKPWTLHYARSERVRDRVYSVVQDIQVSSLERRSTMSRVTIRKEGDHFVVSVGGVGMGLANTKAEAKRYQARMAKQEKHTAVMCRLAKKG